MDYPIDCSQKIDAPITIEIKLGIDSVCEMKINAGFHVDAHVQRFGNNCWFSIEGFKPDKNIDMLLNDLPAFLHMLADHIADHIEVDNAD